MSSTYDPQAGRAAFEQMTERLEAQTELTRINGRLQLAAVASIRVADDVGRDSERAKFAELAGFDMQHFDDLRPLGWALWHALVELDKARVGVSSQQVALELLEQATERKERMISVLGYHLGDDAIVARELAAIRSGAGYLDIASDLTRLAALYEVQAEALAADVRHYDAADAPAARSDAESILRSLADTAESNEAQWMIQVRRAWTALLTSYNELRAAAQWIYRADPQLDRRFPSLHSVVRPTRSRRSGPTEEPPPPVVGIGEPTTVEPTTAAPA